MSPSAPQPPRPRPRNPQAAGGRTAYLVLGMHRSGTSAVTQLLALAGAQLPANVMPGDEHNAKGYFEPWKIAMFDDQRLRAAGSAWDDPFAFPFRPLPPEAESDWRDRARALFEAEFAGLAHPLMKDPRASVLLPFWRNVLDGLGTAARAVIAVRHPLAVAGSLGRRDGFHPAKSVLVWTSYMLAAEAYSRDLPRAVVGYDALLADWRREAARIADVHGAPLPRLTEAAARRIDRFLTPDLRHNAAAGALADLGWAGAIAERVLAWFEAAARGDAPDRAPLEAAAAELAARQAQFGDLVSPAARDCDAARSDLLQTRQELAEALRQRRRAEGREAELLAAIDRLERALADQRRLIAEVTAELDAALAGG